MAQVQETRAGTGSATTAMKKLTPVLVVDEIEPCLSFWTDRLGFEKTVELPEGSKLGFVILKKDDVEVMYQSRESVEKDVPALVPEKGGYPIGLFIEVSDVAAVERALRGFEVILPRRKTFYGMDEIGLKEPGGNSVIFAQPVKEGT
jgi:uncharacterized glyoxalase superfamily protein PhnB